MLGFVQSVFPLGVGGCLLGRESLEVGFSLILAQLTHLLLLLHQLIGIVEQPVSHTQTIVRSHMTQTLFLPLVG